MIKTTRKIFRLLSGKQKRDAVVLAVLMFLGGIMESLSVAMILPLVSAVMDSSDWNQSWYASIICELLSIDRHRDYIIALIVLLIIVFVVKNLFLLFEYNAQYLYITRGRVQIQADLMHKYMHKDYTFFLNSNSGEIIRIVTSDTGQVFTLISFVMSYFTEIITCGIIGITVFVVSPDMTVIMAIILLLELFIITKVIKPIMARLGNSQRVEYAMANKWIIQALNGIKSIKVSYKEGFFEENYIIHANKGADVDRKNRLLGDMPRLMIEACTIVSVLIVILIMILNGNEIVSIVPKLSAFMMAAIRLLPSINRISGAINQTSFLEGGLDNILHILDTEGDFRHKEQEQKKQNDEITFNDELVLDRVSFLYPDTEKKILSSSTLRILPGQSIGIVGASGAGKTTLVDILLGLLQPCSGQVVSDGKDISINMKSWLSNVAYIPQSIFLMDDSIKKNIAFGENEEDVDEEKIWRVIKEAQLLDYVSELEDGVNTMVGEAGVRLSGGQRQRIGIARALYTDAEILFFDEATSALDNETEAAIMDAINGLKGKRTLIIIAHRLSTIQNCDAVYRVEDGKIVKELS